MKKFRKEWLCLALLFCVCFFGTTAEAKKSYTIHEGIYIGDVDVSGMTVAEATEAVNAAVETAKTAELTLECVNGEVVFVTPADLGIKWVNKKVADEAVNVGQVGNVVERYKALKDLEKENMVFPIEYEFDEALLDEILVAQCEPFNVEAVNVSLVRENGEFQVVGGTQGLAIDTEAAKTEVTEFLTTKWDGKSAMIKLPVIVDEPLGSAEELAKVKDVIGTYTTEYRASGATRCANIATGCSKINGATLYPGETYDLLEVVCPFTVANGYAMAGSYLNGMVVDSLGGGICQVSTTLYNALLRAEVEIGERHNHSMVVSYVSPSADAAIAESTNLNFTFTNTLEHPIYIEGFTSPNKTVTFNIYGVETRPENRQVRFETEIVETIHPTTENIVQTVDQPLGFSSIQNAYLGYKARLWKIVTVDGVEESREIVNTSKYKMVPRTITVGVSTPDVNAYNEMQAAIATGSVDHVKAMADMFAQRAAEQAAQQAPPQ